MEYKIYRKILNICQKFLRATHLNVHPIEQTLIEQTFLQVLQSNMQYNTGKNIWYIMVIVNETPDIFSPIYMT